MNLTSASEHIGRVGSFIAQKVIINSSRISTKTEKVAKKTEDTKREGRKLDSSCENNGAFFSEQNISVQKEFVVLVKFQQEL